MKPDVRYLRSVLPDRTEFYTSFPEILSSGGVESLPLPPTQPETKAQSPNCE